MEKKICYSCGKEKPTSEFNFNKTKKDGFGTECKSCVRQYGLKCRAIRKEKNKNAKPDYRNCPRCGNTKQSSEFHSALTNIDGLSTYCKECRTEIRTKKQEKKRCKICGKYFLPKRDNRLYCSKKCSTEAYWNNITYDKKTTKLEEYNSTRRLSDSYAIRLLKKSFKTVAIPEEFVEIKKIELKVKRLLKSKNDENTETR